MLAVGTIGQMANIDHVREILVNYRVHWHPKNWVSEEAYSCTRTRQASSRGSSRTIPSCL